MPFCKHRFTNIKQWTSGATLCVIQRCRWCNIWQRIETAFNTMEAKVIPYKLSLEPTSNKELAVYVEHPVNVDQLKKKWGVIQVNENEMNLPDPYKSWVSRETTRQNVSEVVDSQVQSGHSETDAITNE